MNLHGERVDGTGTVTHPIERPTFDEVLRIWRRLAVVTTAHAWRWSIDVD